MKPVQSPISSVNPSPRRRVAFAAVITLLWSGLAQANVSYERAPVVDVEPIYETVSYSVPTEVCRDEEVAVHTPRRRGATGPILGAVIGGAIGHAVGHRKRNKQVGAAVGAVLGGSIGADISRQRARYGETVRYRTERVCHQSEEIREEERQVGYRVSYLYGGETYRTTTETHPGDSIRVRVAVSPAGL
ncbi:MAG: glycine zipper 2TM domain-containing protein [Pseudomonadota bacterium]